ncbi:unnamed protein product [Schistosoma margrebowiei]|uniref:Uncharacterized protein n=1 Tax=Schistosoma margrebowiei TaxID=48269 RepID=A0A183MNT9_9TREM|nr:unnamed protein product [Schistosoma margrebowiei]
MMMMMPLSFIRDSCYDAHQFYPLVQINCSKDLRFLLCSIYTPICIKGYPHFLPPCRSICQRVKAGCSPIMEHYEFPWPERMNCEQFPEYNNPDGILCMERNLTHEEQLEFQSINIKNNEQFKSINQSSINQLNELSNNLHMTTQLQIINTNDQMKSLSLEEIELKNQFNEEASHLLFEKAIQNDDIRKLKMTFPNLHLKCTCDCRPPLINIKNSEINNNAKITVADIKDCSMPCYTPYYTFDSSYNFTTFWLGIWSTLCAISTMITIFTFITDSYRFQYPELPLIYLSACYFMISMGYLIRVFMGHQAIACDSLPNEYENTQSTINSNNNNNDNNWFDYNSPNVTLLPNTLTTITKATITTITMKTTNIPSNLIKTTNQLIRSKILRYALTGRVSCAAVFLLIYFFSMAASIWWVILALTWLLAAGFKWGSEAISKYSQVFHFIAWSLPASQTALALLLSIVEGDPITGLCTIQSNQSINYILFIFVPLLIYLIIGIILMIIGFISLFHIRGKIKLQRPRIIEIQKLNKLIIRIGIFGILYIIPNFIILFSISYELHHTYLWQLGIACHCHYDIGQYYPFNNNENENELEPILPIALPVWNSPKPQYIIFMLKHFMNLIIGIISGFWIWSNKTIQSWKQFCLYKLCLLQLNKHKNNNNNLLINSIHYNRLHKNYIKQSINIPSINSIQSMIHNKSIHHSINQYPILIDNNEHCNTIVMTTNGSIITTITTTTTTTTTTSKQHNTKSYDLMNNGILSNINSLVTLSTPSTPFSTHPYDIPNHHDIHYKSTLNAYYSIDGSTISQQYGDVNSYHTNNSFSNSNNNNNNVDNKFMITNTKSYVTQLSGHSMNPSFSTLSSSLNSPHKSSISYLNNNNHNNLNHANNNNSISTSISSSGISSSHINDGLTRTASIMNGSELNSNLISPKLIDYYFNGEQRNCELIGSQLTTTTTTITTTAATTALPMIKYDHNIDETNLRRNNHSVFVNNQFVSNMMNENHKK